ncbi:MAG: phospholipid carrier-dependent glycosyltransferase [Chloroflexota bacterium]
MQRLFSEKTGPRYNLRMKVWEYGLLLLILAVGLALRWTGLDWDGYHHYHPDERYITWVATTIEWPNDLAVALSPTRSTFNPFYWSPEAESRGIAVLQDQPRNFAYGHVPLYAGVAATRLMEWSRPFLLTIFPSDWLLTRDVVNGIEAVEFRHLTAVSRALTGLIDVGTIWLIFLLGRRLYDTAVGLLAAFFLAVNVMHIQLSHFFISDPYMTFFVVAAIYLLVAGLTKGREQSGGRWHVWAAAVCVGLAIGSKFAAVLLILPLLLVVWLLWQERFVWGAITAVFITFLAFFITNPFAILDLNCELLTPPVQLGPIAIPEINWRSCYLDNIILQGNMVRGNLVAPFTYQYDGTIPYLYYIEMQLKAGMGPLLGLAAFIGFAWVIFLAIRTTWQIIQQRDWYALRITHYALISVLPLAFLIPYFLSTGNFFVKFMRYLQPMTPFLMIYAAALLWQIRQRQVRGVVVGLVGGLTAVYALAFITIYQQEHPWTAASKWV